MTGRGGGSSRKGWGGSHRTVSKHGWLSGRFWGVVARDAVGSSWLRMLRFVFTHSARTPVAEWVGVWCHRKPEEGTSKKKRATRGMHRREEREEKEEDTDKALPVCVASVACALL